MLFIFLSDTIYLIILTYFHILFVSHVKKFKQALLQAAIERLVKHGSNDIEIKQFKKFLIL